MFVNIIIILIFAVCIFFAIRGAVKHFKGESSCCGGGSSSIVDKKTLSLPIKAKVQVDIEGMKCKNCAISVQNSLNKIEGLASRVNLKKNRAEIQLEKEFDDSVKKQIEEAVQAAGNYKATAFKQR